MGDPDHLADLQFRVLCKSWNSLTQEQQSTIVSLATNKICNYKDVIVCSICGSLSAITFLVFSAQLGELLTALVSILGFFVGVRLGVFLFDAIINVMR
jgi:hypothetical protein